ncbi:hypothetical protein ACLMAJ_24980 [Nocardia sp. KC 131]|uniref:hypothetical protein n=1 Tax=Nocardia arseniciresistens TaxID=3392119 RepID=UPI00398E67E4
MTEVGKWINENTPGFDDQAAPENNKLIESGTDYRDEYFNETLFPFHNIGLKKDGKGVLEVLGGTVAGDAWTAYSDLRSANIADAIFGGIGVGLDIEEAVTDPFGFVGSQIAGWMLEHLDVYRKTLDALAGSPDMVGAYAKTWTNIATELVKVSTEWKTGVEQDISTWTGASGDAYRAKATDLIDHTSAAGGVAAAMGETMTKTATIVKAVRTLVGDIVASLVGALIAYTIELACTLGAATPAVIAQVMGRFARDGFKIATLLAKMGDAFKDLSGFAKVIGDAIVKLLTPSENEQPAPA